MMINNLEELVAKAKDLGCQRVAIAAAADVDILKVVDQAERAGLATCLLVGDKARITAIAAALQIKINSENILDVPDEKEAARKVVAMVRNGEADMIMKGLLSTADFLRAVVDRELGLRTNRLLSQITVCGKIRGDGLMLLTDCAMNIAPTLPEKKQIIENAVAVARQLGYDRPKVALICAVETVNPDMPETLEAAALSKMGDRGQIKDAIIDGPLALDNSVSLEAARHKGISSEVAGRADILVAPDIKVGNVLHKALIYFAGKPAAGIIAGARAPIIITSRSDSPETKLLSVALANYLAAQAKR